MTEKIDTIVRFSPLDIWKICRAHWKAKVPVNFIAEPSTVKSDGVKAFSMEQAEREGREFFDWNKRHFEDKQNAVANPEKYFVFGDLRASETDIGELRLQDMKSGVNYITFKYNILVQELSTPKAKGVLFFDEMNLAPNMIKAQFYKIINDRAVGDIPISEGVLCVSAGNESEHSRGVTEDPVPLVLRRGNYFLRPLTQEEYTDYAVKTAQHRWVVGYLAFQPQYVHEIKYDLPDSIGQPCPRTWTKLSQILKANPELNLEDVEMVATGMVGQGVAKQFAAYVKSAKEINLNDILQDPKLVKQYEDKEEMSLIYAIISGVVDKFRDEKKVMKPAFEMCLHFTRPEFGAFLLRSMKQIDEKQFLKAGGDTKIVDEALAKQVIDRYAKFLFKDAS